MKFVLLACAGGAIGAGLRHIVNTIVVSGFGLNVAWATLFVNVAGSLAMGLVAAYVMARLPAADPGLRIFLATGVLGGFTTFSAFSLDAVAMVERGETGLAALYIGLSLVLSVAACAAGLLGGRSVWV